MNVDAVQRWLNEHCAARTDVCAGVVVRSDTNGEYAPCAGFPEGLAPATQTALMNIAREAAKRGSPVMLVPAAVQADAGYTRVVASPVRTGAMILGAVALAVRSPDAAVAKRLQDELERMGVPLAAAMTTPKASASSVSADMMQCQEWVASAVDLTAAALKLAEHAVQAGRFDRVSVGWRTQGSLRLLAMSGNKSVDDRQALTRLLAAAMEECADQGKTLLYPVDLPGEALVSHMHAQAASRLGTALCSAPLRAGERVLGAITFERKGGSEGDGLTAVDRDWCDAHARLLAPLLDLKWSAGRSAWRRAVDSVPQMWRGGAGRKRGAAVAALSLLAACLWPVTFEVAAPARVEGVVQRVLAAPVDGFLRQTRVRPGDSVKQGDVLVELADQDLLLEKKRWESELARHQNNFSLALGKSDRGQFAVNFARAAEAKAQLELVESQLARAQGASDGPAHRRVDQRRVVGEAHDELRAVVADHLALRGHLLPFDHLRQLFGRRLDGLDRQPHLGQLAAVLRRQLVGGDRLLGGPGRRVRAGEQIGRAHV